MISWGSISGVELSLDCVYSSSAFSLWVKAPQLSSCSQTTLPSTLHLFFFRLIWIWLLEGTSSFVGLLGEILFYYSISQQPTYRSSQYWAVLRAVTSRRCSFIVYFFSPFKIIFNVEVNCGDMDKNLRLHTCNFKYWGKIVAVYARWMPYFSVWYSSGYKTLSFNDVLRIPFKEWKHLYLSSCFPATILIYLRVWKFNMLNNSQGGNGCNLVCSEQHGQSPRVRNTEH